jgi:hypothetical protein
MPVCTVREGFVTGLILAIASAAMAQDGDKHRTPYYGGGGSSLISLLTKPGVQAELDLGEAGSKSLLGSLQEIDPKHIAFWTLEERRQNRTLYDETTRKSETAIQKLLSEDQFRRFQQVEARYLGGQHC